MVLGWNGLLVRGFDLGSCLSVTGVSLGGEKPKIVLARSPFTIIGFVGPFVNSGIYGGGEDLGRCLDRGYLLERGHIILEQWELEVNLGLVLAFIIRNVDCWIEIGFVVGLCELEFRLVVLVSGEGRSGGKLSKRGTNVDWFLACRNADLAGKDFLRTQEDKLVNPRWMDDEIKLSVQ